MNNFIHANGIGDGKVPAKVLYNSIEGLALLGEQSNQKLPPENFFCQDQMVFTEVHSAVLGQDPGHVISGVFIGFRELLQGHSPHVLVDFLDVVVEAQYAQHGMAEHAEHPPLAFLAERVTQFHKVGCDHHVAKGAIPKLQLFCSLQTDQTGRIEVEVLSGGRFDDLQLLLLMVNPVIRGHLEAQAFRTDGFDGGSTRADNVPKDRHVRCGSGVSHVCQIELYRWYQLYFGGCRGCLRGKILHDFIGLALVLAQC